MNGILIATAMNGIEVDGVLVPMDELSERTFICDYCGERHLIENVTVFDDKEWCECCLEDRTFICDNCGERHYNDEWYTVYNGGIEEAWCEYCAETESAVCDNCGNRFSLNSDDLTEVRGGAHVCESCLNYDYYYCDECDEYVRDYDWDCELEMCCSCADERRAEGDVEPRSDNARVRGYHCAPPMRWFGEPFTINGLNYHKGIGIELEVDREYNSGTAADMQIALNRIDEIAGERVYFEHDGSLNDGFEIITQPHTLEAFDEIPWEDIMRACTENGFSSHDVGTCGLHVHFSREMFGDDTDTQDENITKLVQFIELYWDDMVKASRRTESQLHWAGKKGTISKKKLKEHVKSRNGGHYEAVNNSNNHTVEIRIMRGTLNLGSFNACIDLLVTLVKNACRLDDVTDSADMLEGCKPETLDYLSRQLAFAHAVSELRYR